MVKARVEIRSCRNPEVRNGNAITILKILGIGLDVTFFFVTPQPSTPLSTCVNIPNIADINVY